MKTLFDSQDQYNLSPIKYRWAFERYKEARQNFWNPEQIPMGRDVASFQTLTHTEREMFLDVFAMLTTSDLAIQENIASRIYEVLTPPEVRLWLGHQLADESLHSYSYQHVIECLALDDASIYQRYRQRPYILGKFVRANGYGQKLLNQDPASKTLGIAFFYLCWEGIWFYHGFSPIFALGRRGKMPGTCEQLQYIAKDEVTHFHFGVDLVNALIDENDLRNNTQFIDDIYGMFHSLVEGEKFYAEHCIKDIVGYSADIHVQHTKYLADVRLQQIGLNTYFNVPSTLPWLSEMIELKKEKNFFESHVNEYQTGSKLEFENASLDDISNWK